MSTVAVWTGREVRALRLARRMAVRDFAAHLGVSDRMVSKWEAAGEHLRPRPINQAALDTSLNLADDIVQRRVAQFLAGPATGTTPSAAALADSVHALIRHPIDGRLMTMIDAGPGVNGRTWMVSYFIDVHPVSGPAYARFLDLTGHAHPLYGRPRHDEPVSGVDWADAQAYARWAGKELPDAAQWDKAARGTEGMAPGDVREWCHILGQPATRGRSRPRGGFRCAAPAASVLSLLAI